MKKFKVLDKWLSLVLSVTLTANTGFVMLSRSLNAADYMDITEVSPTGQYVTVSGVVDGVYVPGSLTITPPSGFQISCSHAGDVSNTYVDSLTLTEENLGDGWGNVNYDAYFSFKRLSDGAVTNDIFISSDALYPFFGDLLFDSESPEIYGYDAETVEITDGSTIYSDEFTLTVSDRTLEKVVVNGETHTGGDFSEQDDNRTYYWEDFDLDAGESKQITVSATDILNRTTSVSFTLKSTMLGDGISATVTVASPLYYGDSYEPVVKVNGTDEPYTYELTYDGEETEKPTSVGEHTVTALISFDNYPEDYLDCEYTYLISQKAPTSSVSVPDVMLGVDYTPSLTTDSDGRADASFFYKPAGDPDTSYSQTKPTAAGTYTCMASIPETENYLSDTCTTNFTIGPKEASASVSVGTVYAGTSYVPSVVTNSDGLPNATYEYKEKNAPDSSYTTKQPTAAGNYVVRVTIPATLRFKQVVCKADYSINYLPAPANPYSFTGTSGNNGFFTSDVTLNAPDGYQISADINSQFTSSIAYSDDLNVVYLKRNSDGALTAAVPLSTRPQIDKEAPKIMSTSKPLIDGSALFSDNLIISVTDDNLLSLTVNGKAVNLTAQGGTLTLSPGNGIKIFEIVAEDKAGNINTIEITLMASWLESRIIPADLRLPLDPGEGYTLDLGTWVVTDENGNEDTTVYNGGVQIFVNGKGEYIFRKAT